MIIETNSVKTNVSSSEDIYSAKDLIVFLHGFTGSIKDWDDVRKNIDTDFPTIAIDLVGHGLSDSPTDLSLYTADSITSQLSDVINHFTKEKIILVGYSMGGRATLSFAIKYPEKIKALILESTSPGIKDNVERIKRKKSDDELAEYILTNPIENFVDKWMNLELFNSQKSFPEKKLLSIRNQKLLNNKIGLANSLKGFGTGVMPHLYDVLNNIIAPTLLVTGELDEKFTGINIGLQKQLHSATHSIVKFAGHNTHLENPKEFIYSISTFLSKF